VKSEKARLDLTHLDGSDQFFVVFLVALGPIRRDTEGRRMLGKGSHQPLSSCLSSSSEYGQR
jgi:hypothetical protein